jgi:pSer/pThr/pTyr-binding forkhead associated (FHA) protein
MGWPILAALKPTAELVQVALDRPVCVVGARSRVSLPLNSPHVSKAHAIIVHEAGGVYVRDLVSLNKTFVNKRPVRESWLSDRDIIQFATVAFVCRSGFGRPLERQSAPTVELWMTAAGGVSTEVIPLGQETFLIGSREGCDLLLEDKDVASAHAIIFVRDGRRYLRNLSPAENTLIDGRFQREAELQGEELVQIGHRRLEVHLAESVMTLQDDEAPIPWDQAVEEADDVEILQRG